MIKQHSIGLILATAFAILSCQSGADQSVSTDDTSENSTSDNLTITKEQFETSGMSLGSIHHAEFHDVIRTNGMFDVPPKNQASVSAYFGGTVKDIQLITGQAVKKGQTLFTLENPDFIQVQQDYLEAKGQLAYLKSDYERQKNLSEDNVTSRKTFLKAESDYTVTNVRVEALRKTLTLMNIDPDALTPENIRTTINIMSPLNGYVTTVNIARGAFLSPSHTAVTIVDTDHLHIELHIFEKDLARVRIGQKIRFRIQESSDTTYLASVYLINKTVDADSRTIGIHAHLEDESDALKFSPGMYVEADIFTDAISRPALPESAIVDMEGQYFVLVLQSNEHSDQYQFIRREIIPGKSNDHQIEILNAKDFSDSTKFLIQGAFNLITE